MVFSHHCRSKDDLWDRIEKCRCWNNSGTQLSKFKPMPSEHDLIITKNVIEAGKPLDLQILDHLILTKHNYLSFGDEGLL